MGTLEARGVVAGFLLLATNVPISAVAARMDDRFLCATHYVIKYLVLVAQHHIINKIFCLWEAGNTNPLY
jgi:hypothetical protein